jgi:hypothetical protein
MPERDISMLLDDVCSTWLQDGIAVIADELGIVALTVGALQPVEDRTRPRRWGLDAEKIGMHPHAVKSGRGAAAAAWLESATAAAAGSRGSR